MSNSPEWLGLHGFFFFALRNVRIIISVEYQFLNIFFSFCLILFAFNLAAVSLFLLFGTTRIYSHLLPDLKKKKNKKKNYMAVLNHT